jgi:hypothetical protein
MRKGMNGLALQVQEALGRDPQAWLADVLARIAEDSARDIDALLHGIWQPHAAKRRRLSIASNCPGVFTARFSELRAHKP